MRKAILSAVLVLTAAPLAAQTVFGLRAGVGFARQDFSGIVFAPCLPTASCHGVPSDWILSPLISADVSHTTTVEELNIRVSVTYAVKGGAGSGRDARGMPSSGRLSLHFLQFSPLLAANMRSHPQGRYAASLLFGP